MKKEDKAIIIEQLKERISEYAHFYIVDVTGMNSEATSKFRRKCFEKEIKMLVVKNTLLQKAFEASEVDFTPFFGTLKGNTALLFSNVANAPAKLIKDAAVDGIPGLKAAYAEEGFYVGAEQLDALTSIKSKNEVIADVVALLQSPTKNIISALQSAGQTIHGLLKTMEEK